MKFDSNGIINDVIPFIDKSKSNLSDAKNIVLSINLPNDVNAPSSLKSMIPNDITQIENTLTSLKIWLNKKIDDMNEAERKNQQLFSNTVSVFHSSLAFQTNLATTGLTAGKSAKSILYAERNIGAEIKSGVKSTFIKIEGWFNDRLKDIKNVGAIVWQHTKSVLAAITNVLISIVKGIAQVIETLIDLVVMIGAVGGSIFTGLYDAYQAIQGAITGKEWSSATKAMWFGVMGFVAEDHVGNVVANWYKEGNWLHGLDEAAYAPFKSDGVACQIGSGIGYIAGLIMITIATLGIGGVAIAGVSGASTIVSGVVIGSLTFSSATASVWAEQRDKSWEGIEKSFKNGKLDKETYEAFKNISNISEVDWQAIEEAYQLGELTKEDYDMIKSIREMPKEWQTTENLFAGLKEGGWEGLKAAVITMATIGVGKLAAVSIKGQLPKIVSKLPKYFQPIFNRLIGATVEDTVENTVQFSGEMIATGGSWSQSWANIGGLAGLGLSFVLEFLFHSSALPGTQKKGLKSNLKISDTLIKAQKNSGSEVVDWILNAPTLKNNNFLSNNKVLNRAQFNVFSNLVLSKSIDKISDLEVIYIISNMLENKYLLSLPKYYKLLEACNNSLAKVNNINSRFEIKNIRKDWGAQYQEYPNYNLITLNKQYCFPTKLLENLEGIFHENVHADQFTNKQYTFLHLTVAKDRVLQINLPAYYDKYYWSVSYEIEARLKADLELGLFLHKYAPNTYKSYQTQLDNIIKEETKNLDDMLSFGRNVNRNHQIRLRNLECDNIIMSLNPSNRKSLLNEFPVLKFEYLDNGDKKSFCNVFENLIKEMDVVENLKKNSCQYNTTFVDTYVAIFEDRIARGEYTINDLRDAARYIQKNFSNFSLYKKDLINMHNLLENILNQYNVSIW